MGGSGGYLIWMKPTVAREVGNQKEIYKVEICEAFYSYS